MQGRATPRRMGRTTVPRAGVEPIVPLMLPLREKAPQDKGRILARRAGSQSLMHLGLEEVEARREKTLEVRGDSANARAALLVKRIVPARDALSTVRRADVRAPEYDGAILFLEMSGDMTESF